jgi:hypothetical protein
VLAEDEKGAMDALAKTLSAIREAWEPKTTARNLQLSKQRPDLPEHRPAFLAGFVFLGLRSSIHDVAARRGRSSAPIIAGGVAATSKHQRRLFSGMWPNPRVIVRSEALQL